MLFSESENRSSVQGRNSPSIVLTVEKSWNADVTVHDTALMVGVSVSNFLPRPIQLTEHLGPALTNRTRTTLRGKNLKDQTESDDVFQPNPVTGFFL